MILFNKEFESVQLVNSGFRPQKFGIFVKILRKILWPFIRPFHFYQIELLERFTEQNKQTLEQLKTDISLIKMELNQMNLSNCSKIIKSDLKAVGNRLLILEDHVLKKDLG